MFPEMEAYLNLLTLRLAPLSVVTRRYMMKAFYNYLEKNHKTSSLLLLTQQDIEQYLRSINGATQYRQTICYMLKDFFEFVKHPDNPALDIVFMPLPPRRLFKVPSQLFVQTILSKFSKETGWLNLRTRLILEIAYGSGLRRSELTRLNIEDIDLNDSSLRVNGKGDRIRVVPLTHSAIEAIRTSLNQKKMYRGPLLTSKDGKRLAPMTIYTICVKRIGIRPHLLRHACATHMLKNGCSTRVIQELLGHTSLKSTQIYTEVLKDDLRLIVEKHHPRGKQLRLGSS
jgi:integrase/recombinase XerD